MRQLRLCASIVFLNVFLTSAYAAKPAVPADMVKAISKITGLEQALAAARKDAGVAVQFPAVIPKTEKSYFANYDTGSKQFGFNYMINVDATADCHGVKYCNVGMVSARANAAVDKMTNRHHKAITVAVKLADGTSAYYTPGHAMGDYFPASIQWVDHKVLYMISWNFATGSVKDTRAALVTMADSARLIVH